MGDSAARGAASWSGRVAILRADGACLRRRVRCTAEGGSPRHAADEQPPAGMCVSIAR